MNLPNKLTTARFLLAIPFIYFLQNSKTGGLRYQIIALVIFIIASLTDFFDGYLARTYNLITDFGKIMDPLADKILVISALVIFVELGYIPAWMAIIVLAREFLISGIRILAAVKGEVIPAGNLGKYKTNSQMLAIIICIIFGQKTVMIKGSPYTIAYLLMIIPILLTIWSGIEYTFKAKHYFINKD